MMMMLLAISLHMCVYLICAVYNSELGNFYIHHDYLLPALPLVVEWLDFDGYDQSPGK